MPMNMAKVLLVAAWLGMLTAVAKGHGRLLNPPARSTAWRMGFPTQVNYNDHETNCGGFNVLHERFKGKCGVCGDPFGGPKLHEPGPDNVYSSGTIVRIYQQGQIITADVEITASHKGFYEFKLCKNDVPQKGRNYSIAVQQHCFNRILLKAPDGKSSFDEGVRNITLKLPDGVTCTACVLQWRWKTGNSWGCDKNVCGIGIGDQEEFYACADIAIVTRGGHRAPSSSPGRFPGRFTTAATKPRSLGATRSDLTPTAASSSKEPGSGRRMSCRGLEPWGSRHDDWCNANCKHIPPFCPPSHCECSLG